MDRIRHLAPFVQALTDGECDLAQPNVSSGGGERQTDGAARFFEETLLQVARKVAVGSYLLIAG